MPSVTSAPSSGTASHDTGALGALDFRGVSIVYPARRDQGPLHVVDDVSLSIEPGEFVVMVGPSGCGKTSLLKAAAALQDVTAGSITIDGAPVGRTGAGSDVSVVFQAPRLLPWLDLVSNVAFPLEARKVSRRERLARAGEEIARVRLDGFERSYPGELSGGMQQRANLARALCADSAVLLLDEPFGALDAQTREHMQAELLRMLAERNRTALFITHQVDEAVFLADRIVVLGQRPAQVLKVIRVPFPRPRPPEIRKDPEFHRIHDEVWDLLHRSTSADAQHGTSAGSSA